MKQRMATFLRKANESNLYATIRAIFNAVILSVDDQTRFLSFEIGSCHRTQLSHE
jgi:hypothetical protein